MFGEFLFLLGFPGCLCLDCIPGGGFCVLGFFGGFSGVDVLVGWLVFASSYLCFSFACPMAFAVYYVCTL